MSAVLITQLALPLIICVLLAAARPPANRWALAARAVAALMLLWGVARIGVWVFPPWWTPLAAAAFVLSVGGWQIVRRLPARVFPSGRREWIGMCLLALPVALGGYVGLRAALGRALPDGAVVDLAFPFDDGRYLVVNGGGWPPINAHRTSARAEVARYVPWRGNGWAIDLIAIDRFGLRARGFRPRDPAAYLMFGMPVLAPCAGAVAAAVDGRPDMPVPEHDRPLIAGNHVVLSCGDVHVVLAHLRQGSVVVGAGDTVDIGQPIGQVGNSGKSDEPHLHIHAQLPGPSSMPMGGEPVPITFGGRFLIRGDRVRLP